MGVLSDVNLHFIVQAYPLARMKFRTIQDTKRWTHAEAQFFHPHLHESKMAVSIVLQSTNLVIYQVLDHTFS